MATENVDAWRPRAHDLLKLLLRRCDVVIQNTDEEWCLQYFRDPVAKMAQGGCCTAYDAARACAPQIFE